MTRCRVLELVKGAGEDKRRGFFGTCVCTRVCVCLCVCRRLARYPHVYANHILIRACAQGIYLPEDKNSVSC